MRKTIFRKHIQERAPSLLLVSQRMTPSRCILPAQHEVLLISRTIKRIIRRLKQISVPENGPRNFPARSSRFPPTGHHHIVFRRMPLFGRRRSGGKMHAPHRRGDYFLS